MTAFDSGDYSRQYIIESSATLSCLNVLFMGVRIYLFFNIRFMWCNCFSKVEISQKSGSQDHFQKVNEALPKLNLDTATNMTY